MLFCAFVADLIIFFEVIYKLCLLLCLTVMIQLSMFEMPKNRNQTFECQSAADGHRGRSFFGCRVADQLVHLYSPLAFACLKMDKPITIFRPPVPFFQLLQHGLCSCFLNHVQAFKYICLINVCKLNIFCTFLSISLSVCLSFTVLYVCLCLSCPN